MSIDQVLRALGTVACLYTVGLCVSAMTVASLGAVGFETASLCTGRDCRPHTLAAHHATPVSNYDAVFAASVTYLDRN